MGEEWYVPPWSQRMLKCCQKDGRNTITIPVSLQKNEKNTVDMDSAEELALNVPFPANDIGVELHTDYGDSFCMQKRRH